MNPTRRRRLNLILLLVAAGATAGTLVTLALQENMTYLFTPSEVLDGQTGDKAVFRLGGMVAEGSFKRAGDGTLRSEFAVTDGDNRIVVDYDGILPDLFREKQAVIATGRMQDGRFAASKVLAKHDETYVPKEVADKMGLAHQKHNVKTPADPPAGGQ